jgi:hypothetical protein
MNPVNSCIVCVFYYCIFNNELYLFEATRFIIIKLKQRAIFFLKKMKILSFCQFLGVLGLQSPCTIAKNYGAKAFDLTTFD